MVMPSPSLNFPVIAIVPFPHSSSSAKSLFCPLSSFKQTNTRTKPRHQARNPNIFNLQEFPENKYLQGKNSRWICKVVPKFPKYTEVPKRVEQGCVNEAKTDFRLLEVCLGGSLSCTAFVCCVYLCSKSQPCHHFNKWEDCDVVVGQSVILNICIVLSLWMEHCFHCVLLSVNAFWGLKIRIV